MYVSQVNLIFFFYWLDVQSKEKEVIHDTQVFGSKNAGYLQYMLRCKRLGKNSILGFGEKMRDNEFVIYILS